MALKKILIVSGTHGNEINPVWAVNQFCKQNNANENNIEYKFVIGNPLAYERGCRYIDNDLNRSFNFNKDNLDISIYENKRAKILVEKFGANGLDPCDIAIDLHTTTANMGTCIVMYGRRRKDFCLAAILQYKFGLPIYLHEKDKKQTGFLVEAWPCGLVLEIGSVAQNLYDPKIVNRFLVIISCLKDEINKLKNNQIKLPKSIVVYVHQGSIDYPREKNGKINALIHPERINQDWMPLKKGDPLFIDIGGNTNTYKGEDTIWPVFIGEVAYREKNIAMSYTKKEVIYLSDAISEEFFR